MHAKGNNQETTADDLAITKLTLEVDAGFGPYMFCNVNAGVYSCDCGWNGTTGHPVPCPPSQQDHFLVGVKNIHPLMHPPKHPPPGTNASDPASRVDFWEHNARLLVTGSGHPGFWYSTTADGQCGVGKHCTWRVVKAIKKIWKNCSDNVIGDYVEKRNASCFKKCEAAARVGNGAVADGDAHYNHRSQSPPAKLNRSSICYTNCFFASVLGPDSDHVYNSSVPGGLPAAELIALWDKPFQSSSVCKNLLPVMRTAGEQPEQRVGASPPLQRPRHSGGRAPRHPAPTEPSPSFCDNDGEWKVAWEDNFDGSKLNETVWTIPTGVGSSFGRDANVTSEDTYIEDGMLVLRSRQVGPANWTTGAAISHARKEGSAGTTGASWKYGRFCIRAKLPGAGPGRSQGLWPAHWMMPSDYSQHCGYNEIDVMEMVDGNNHIWGTYWYWGPGGGGPPGKANCSTGTPVRAGEAHVSVPTYFSQFHEFAVEWTPESLTFLVDSVPYKSYIDPTQLPANPHFIMLNTAVGGAWPGLPNQSTVFPAYHYIDFVRVAQKPSY